MPAYDPGYALAGMLMSLVLPAILLVANVVLGVICMNLAKVRGFHKAAAFFAGLLGGLVSLCIILMFPIKSEETGYTHP